MSFTDQLLADVQRFVIESGMSESAIGQGAVGNPSVLARLRAGKTITFKTGDAIAKYMAAERARSTKSFEGDDLPVVPAGPVLSKRTFLRRLKLWRA